MKKLLLTGLLVLSTTPAFAARNVVQPFTCNVTGNPETASASIVSVPNRGANLQLIQTAHQPTTFQDFPGGNVLKFKGTLSTISFAVNGPVNDARIGPHVSGIATTADGSSSSFFDAAAGSGTISAADSQGYRTVTLTAAQLGLNAGSIINVLTINIAGVASNHTIPVTELIDSITINGQPTAFFTEGTSTTCPFTVSAQ